MHNTSGHRADLGHGISSSVAASEYRAYNGPNPSPNWVQTRNLFPGPTQAHTNVWALILVRAEFELLFSPPVAGRPDSVGLVCISP